MKMKGGLSLVLFFNYCTDEKWLENLAHSNNKYNFVTISNK